MRLTAQETKLQTSCKAANGEKTSTTKFASRKCATSCKNGASVEDRREKHNLQHLGEFHMREKHEDNSLTSNGRELKNKKQQPSRMRELHLNRSKETVR